MSTQKIRSISKNGETMHYNMIAVIRTSSSESLRAATEADLGKVISTAMAPYNEERSERGFWDWYVIGGRYAGSVLRSRLGHERLKVFDDALASRKVMVKAVRCGKEELADAQTEEVVDAIWRYMFPDSGLATCPLFKHGSPSQYDKRGELPYDVCTVADVPQSHSVHTIALVTVNHADTTYIDSLLHSEIWNGATFQKTTWDGTFGAALSHFNERLARYREPESVNPNDVVVTLDYHS